MAEIYRIGSDDLVDRVSTFGGTNLIKGTQNWDNPSWTVKNTTYLTLTSDVYENTTIAKIIKSASTSFYVDILACNAVIVPEPNTWYTLSFWAKADAAMPFISYFYPTCVEDGRTNYGANVNGRSATGSDGNTTTTLTTDWKRYAISWKTIATVSGAKNVLLCRLLAATTGTCYFAGVKFEKGNKDTDWTPAPEDLVTYDLSNESLVFFQ